MDEWIGVAVVAVVLVGAALQRVAGMGFAMVVAPLVTLVLTGQQGVVLANILGCLAALALIWPVRRDIDWARFALLTASSIVGSAIAAPLVSALDLGVFRVVVGAVLAVSILASLVITKTAVHASHRAWALAAGGATGALVTMSGIGGPPMTIYAVISRWGHRSFAATMQPYVAASSFVGAASVLAVSPSSFPQLPAWVWIASLCALVAGLVLGHTLGRALPAAAGRMIVIVLGLLGAASAVASGISVLAGR